MKGTFTVIRSSVPSASYRRTESAPSIVCCTEVSTLCAALKASSVFFGGSVPVCDAVGTQVIGRMSVSPFTLGQKVQVVVVDVDKISRTVDFAIPDAKGEIFWKDYV